MWNFLKIDRLLTKSFTPNFKERYRHKRKESQVSNLKSCLPEEALKEKSAKDVSLYDSSIFLKDLSGLEKLHLPLKDYIGRYFWLSLGEQIFAGFFPVSFFLRSKKKYTAKKHCRNSVNENSSNFRRNTIPPERWKNYAKRRQSQTYT